MSRLAIAVKVKNLNGEIIGTYNSLVEAAEDVNAVPQLLGMYLKNKIKEPMFRVEKIDYGKNVKRFNLVDTLTNKIILEKSTAVEISNYLGCVKQNVYNAYRNNRVLKKQFKIKGINNEK